MPELARLRAAIRRPIVIDAFLAACVAVPGLAGLPWSSPGTSAGAAVTAGAIALLAVSAGTVVARRRWPILAAVTGGVSFVIAVQAGWFDPNGSSVDGGFVTSGLLLWAVIMSFALGLVRPIRSPLVALAIVIVAQQWHGLNPFPVVLAGGAYAVGWVVRSRRDLADALDVRAGELASEQQRYATEAVRYERARIARELHDVVAHCMSIVVVQASAGQRLADLGDTTVTDRVFDDIAELARQAESDLAGLTRLLSREPESSPRLSGQLIDQLVARAGTAGTAVTVEVAGDLDTIPSLTAVALTRVLQEGVTNAIKHAPGAPVAVGLRTDQHLTSLDVANGPAPSASDQLDVLGGGNGLRGLRERVSTLGGALNSQPTADGGWLLSAVIPAADASAARPRPVAEAALSLKAALS
jgi:signal transduction histidine kinase